MEHEKIDGDDFIKLMNGEPLEDNSGAPVQSTNDVAPVSEDDAQVIGDNDNSDINETNE